MSSEKTEEHCLMIAVGMWICDLKNKIFGGMIKRSLGTSREVTVVAKTGKSRQDQEEDEVQYEWVARRLQTWESQSYTQRNSQTCYKCKTSSSIQADLLSPCNSFRTADQRWRALAHWPKREVTSWRLDSLMSRLVLRQHRRNSYLSLIRPEAPGPYWGLYSHSSSHIGSHSVKWKWFIIRKMLNKFIDTWGAVAERLPWICRSLVQIPVVPLYWCVITLSKLFTRIYSGQLSLSSFRGWLISTSFSGGLKSFVGLQGAWMPNEAYADNGEFGEFTYASSRRLRSYFAKRLTCHLMLRWPWSTIKYVRCFKNGPNFNFFLKSNKIQKLTSMKLGWMIEKWGRDKTRNLTQCQIYISPEIT